MQRQMKIFFHDDGKHLTLHMIPMSVLVMGMYYELVCVVEYVLVRQTRSLTQYGDACV